MDARLIDADKVIEEIRKYADSIAELGGNFLPQVVIEIVKSGSLLEASADVVGKDRKMEQSNLFCEGNIVKYNGKLGKILKNSWHDSCYWEVDFCTTIKFVHYRDLEYVIDNENNYEIGTGKKWYAEYI